MKVMQPDHFVVVAKDGTVLDPLPVKGKEEEKCTYFRDGQVVVPVLRGPRSRGRPIGGKMKPIKVSMWQNASNISSAAGTALSNVIGVQPSAFQDWANLAPLYDECKVIGGAVYQCLWFAKTATVIESPVHWTTVYDPIDGVALTGVPDALTYAQNMGPKFALGSYGTAVIQADRCPYSMSESGYHVLRFKVPKSPARNTANAVWLQGEWSSTTDAADLYGFIKSVSTAPAALQTVSLSTIVRLDMMFQSRR